MKRLLLVCVLAQAAVGQNPSRGGAILVTVVDTSHGPLVRPFTVTGAVPYTPGSRAIYNSVYARQLRPGRYSLDSLPADSISVQVVCPSVRALANVKADLRFFVRARSTIDTSVVVDHSGCDPRPLRSETRTYSGFYTPGFESSVFAPCANDSWILPSDSLAWLPFEPHAWAKFERYRRKDQVQVHGRAKRDEYGNPVYFVRFHGTMTGPGSYGHMGASQFDFAVDSIISMAGVAPSTCKRVEWEDGRPRREPAPPTVFTDTALFRQVCAEADSGVTFASRRCTPRDQRNVPVLLEPRRP